MKLTSKDAMRLSGAILATIIQMFAISALFVAQGGIA